MRSSTFYSMVFTTSALLVQGVPLGERDVDFVTEVRTVTAVEDSTSTATAVTRTVDGKIVVESAFASASSQSESSGDGGNDDDEGNFKRDMVVVTITQGQGQQAAPTPAAGQHAGQQASHDNNNDDSNNNNQDKDDGNKNGDGNNNNNDDKQDKPSSGGGGGGSSGNKRGLSFNVASLLKPFAGSKASWCYNWGSSADGSCPEGMEYVPMLWGANAKSADKVAAWPAASKKAIAAGAKHVLSFNEPDHPEQAIMSPEDAAKAHVQNMKDIVSAHPDVKIGGPAVTNGPESEKKGLDGWLKPFLAACKKEQCKLDFIPVHWYDSASNFEYFKKHLDDAHKAAGMPIWLTEFGATGSDSEQADFIKKATELMDGLDYVQRYAYFMVDEGKMVKGGQMSEIGKAFVQ